MQITRPDYYKEFTCIADVCPDTCCAGWQIVIDEKSLKKYRRVKGPFRGRLHNDIDWKEQVFHQYHRRCAFLNEKNLCDIYSEIGKEMLCDTCRKYPRHIKNLKDFGNIPFPFPVRRLHASFLKKKKKPPSKLQRFRYLRKPMRISITCFLRHLWIPATSFWKLYRTGKSL